MRMLLVFFGMLLFLGSPLAARSENAHPVDASQLDLEPLSLTSYLSVLEDPSLEISLWDVQQPDTANRFRDNSQPGESLNFGFTQSAYWFRFSLRNPSDQALERMLELNANHLSDFEFYAPKATGQPEFIKTGDAQPFASSPYNNRFFVFPLRLPQEVSEFGCITLSMGVAALIPQGTQGMDTLIQHADAALYQAKAAGRNRAMAYPTT